MNKLYHYILTNKDTSTDIKEQSNDSDWLEIVKKRLTKPQPPIIVNLDEL